MLVVCFGCVVSFVVCQWFSYLVCLSACVLILDVMPTLLFCDLLVVNRVFNYICVVIGVAFWSLLCNYRCLVY